MRVSVWLALFIVTVVLVIFLKYFPYLPGDVGITRLLQSLLPESKRWAQLVSATAEMPWMAVLIAACFLFSWLIAGWRAALMSFASFGGLYLLGMCLGPLIAQPRPSAELVQVTRSLSGFSFPSIFAFNYASTFGFLAVLSAVKTSGKARLAILLVCCLFLFTGWVARVALAAHWPSDVAISYLIGFLWAALLIRLA
jgi:undecaprenyl-diphosphatase